MTFQPADPCEVHTTAGWVRAAVVEVIAGGGVMRFPDLVVVEVEGVHPVTRLLVRPDSIRRAPPDCPAPLVVPAG